MCVFTVLVSMLQGLVSSVAIPVLNASIMISSLL